MNSVKSGYFYNYLLLVLVYVAIFAWTFNSDGEVLYLDDFEDGKIDAKYEFKNHDGDWVEEGGVISQTHEAPATTLISFWMAVLKNPIQDW